MALYMACGFLARRYLPITPPTQRHHGAHALAGRGGPMRVSAWGGEAPGAGEAKRSEAARPWGFGPDRPCGGWGVGGAWGPGRQPRGER